MTPAQQAAIEGVAGRPLEAKEIKQIDPLLGQETADPDVQKKFGGTPFAVDDRNDTAIAALLSAGRTRVRQPCLVGEGTISDALGVPAGPIFIYQLRAAAAVPLPDNPTQPQLASKAMLEQAVRLITEHDFDIGLPSVRTAIDAFVGQLPDFTQQMADAIKALAITPDPIDINAGLSHALNTAEGRVNL